MWRVVRTLIVCAWAAPCLGADIAPKGSSNSETDKPVARIANHWEIGPVAGAEQFPIALGGYCVVQLHDGRQWIPGRGGDAARFDGLEYRFDSARERHIFLSARESYVPMLGGDCPVTYAETKQRIAGKLEYGILHRRRLIFFAGPDEQRRFTETPDKYENVDLVLDGRSVVSMIDDGKWVEGIPGTVVIHRGLRYYFANDFQRRLFLKSPGRYDGSGETVERPNLLMESQSVSERLSIEAFQQNSTKKTGGFNAPPVADKGALLGTLPAMSGYCPVSLRQDGTWVRGRREFSVTFKDIVFFTAGERERDLLKNDPADYLPACNGECAVSLVERKEHVRGSVFHAAEFDGRLFLLADAAAKAKFKSAPEKYALIDVAARGFCAVTLVDEQKQTPGVQQFATWYDGKVYRFAGAAEKAKFLAKPERYAESAE
jgi:YHS domain-containing protein